MSTDTTERLDKQAEAIRALRERLTALEAALVNLNEMIESATRGTERVAEARASVRYTDLPDGSMFPSYCLVCHNPKEDNRARLMTCRDCGRKRADAFKPGGDRSTVTSDKCGLCSKPKPLNTTILCKPCRGVVAGDQR